MNANTIDEAGGGGNLAFGRQATLYKINGGCRKGGTRANVLRLFEIILRRVEPGTKMHPTSFVILVGLCCCFAPHVTAEDALSSSSANENSWTDLEHTVVQAGNEGSAGSPLNRQKRTLLLKKKLIGAGLLGFGLGAVKGFKAGFYTAPQVHHVYLSPPKSSVKYVEYVEKPVYVERIIERPASVFKPAHVEYSDPSPYGAW
ncbi:uncharacterized protein LOC143377503 [Andrena cerasifolii]|uniref:uncharacterized protein LOC143377503 n=1 Tax=Andrena cerasifolii TaxID=2819439 RepID=UPI004037D3AA